MREAAVSIRQMPTATLVCTVLCMLVLAAPASAATVELNTRTELGIKGPDFTVTTVKIDATAGEANTISASGVPSGARLVLSDPATTLTAGAGCTQTAARAIECPLPNEIVAALGDGDDTFAIAPGVALASSLSGGAGDDVLIGGAGADRLSGGGGLDRLVGGLGADSLADDDGPTRDADVLDGGGGDNDSINFEDHTGSMTLDLPAATTSEGDTVSGFETIRLGSGANTLTGTSAGEFVTGGSDANRVDGRGGNDSIYVNGVLRGGDGDDTLACGGPTGCRAFGGAGNDSLSSGFGNDALDGGAGNDELIGLPGDDVLDGGLGDDTLLGDFAEGASSRGGADTLRGGPGRDHVNGGPGADRIDGGSGADLLLALDYSRDAVTCGAGADRLLRDRLDPVKPTGCEHVQLGGRLRLLPRADLTVSLNEVSIEAECPAYAVGSCRGVAEVRDLAGRLLGRRRFRSGGPIDVPLNATGRAILKKGTHTVVVRVRGGDGTGGSSTVRRTYRIKDLA